MCTSYKHKLRWKGKTSDFSPFIDWPVFQGKDTNISLAWSSQGERSRGWEPAVSSTSFRGIRTCWDPLERSQGRGRCHQAWRWDNQGGLGRRSRFRARSLWFWAVEAERDCGVASKKRSFSFNLHHQNRCSRTAALSKFCQNIVLHWSHRNITYCFSMLES